MDDGLYKWVYIKDIEISYGWEVCIFLMRFVLNLLVVINL